MLLCRHQGLSYGKSVALVVISAVLGSTLLGGLAALGFQRLRAKRKAQAEVAFEAALQDSGLGLDDAFEQVCFLPAPGISSDSIIMLRSWYEPCMLHGVLTEYRVVSVRQSACSHFPLQPVFTNHLLYMLPVLFCTQHSKPCYCRQSTPGMPLVFCHIAGVLITA